MWVAHEPLDETGGVERMSAAALADGMVAKGFEADGTGNGDVLLQWGVGMDADCFAGSSAWWSYLRERGGVLKGPKGEKVVATGAEDSKSYAAEDDEYYRDHIDRG